MTAHLCHLGHLLTQRRQVGKGRVQHHAGHRRIVVRIQNGSRGCKQGPEAEKKDEKAKIKPPTMPKNRQIDSKNAPQTKASSTGSSPQSDCRDEIALRPQVSHDGRHVALFEESQRNVFPSALSASAKVKRKHCQRPAVRIAETKNELCALPETPYGSIVCSASSASHLHPELPCR